jgi:hypothetical protein
MDNKYLDEDYVFLRNSKMQRLPEKFLESRKYPHIHLVTPPFHLHPQ